MSVFRPPATGDHGNDNVNVNVTKIHPLKEFSGLLLSALAMIVLLYAVVAVTMEWAVRNISVETENWIWSKLAISSILDEAHGDTHEKRRAYAQKLLNDIPAAQKPHGYRFRVGIVATDEINAYALPGGHILLTSGLLDQMGSENELVFVLGHELGHFAHRDHLRGMGMSFAALLVGVAVMGEHGAIGQAMSSLSALTQMAYSRRDESRADQWALETLQATYGHAAGAAAFFHTLERKEKGFSMPAIFQTHPLNKDRVAAMDQAIAENGYDTGALRALPWKNQEAAPQETRNRE